MTEAGFRTINLLLLQNAALFMPINALIYGHIRSTEKLRTLTGNYFLFLTV